MWVRSTARRFSITRQSKKQSQSRPIRELDAAHLWPTRIVTEVSALTVFYPAEAYHQGYYQKNPYQGYCQMVIAPKVAKFRQKYLAKLSK